MDISNTILVEPTNTKGAEDLVKTNNKTVKKLHEDNIKPSLMILDNRCSKETKQTIKLN